MRQLRADNSENREVMTIKLTTKLLENQRKGGKTQSIADLASRISQKMAQTTGEPGAVKAKAGAQASENEDDEADKRRR